MTKPRTDVEPDLEPSGVLAGVRLAFTGRFASMTQQEAEQLARRHGAITSASVSGRTDVLVVGEDGWPLVAGGQVPRNLQTAINLNSHGNSIEILRETDWLARIGAVEGQSEVHRLYTLSMLARILGVSPATVQGWVRRGLIRPVRHVFRLAYFDFQEAAGAKRIADLIASGVAPVTIERALASLGRLMPGIERPQSQLALLAEGREILVRHGSHLVEPSGQRRFDFEMDDEADEDASVAELARVPSVPRSLATSATRRPTVAELCDLAGDLEEHERLDEAVDVYRKALVLGGPNAEIAFNVAGVLYRLGQAEAARERFYEAVQSDGQYVEAWSNLGCVLSELGQPDEAVEALECALAIHPEYADAHYHLADILEELGRPEDAADHWRAYLAQDHRSTWADEARRRLEALRGMT